MTILITKTLCPLLAVTLTCASLGCMTTIAHPTQATIKDRVLTGDDIEVVMKSGEKRKFQVTAVNETEIRAGYEEPAKYAEIEKVRTYRDARDAATTAGTIVGVVLLVPVAIAGFFGFCFASGGGGIGHW